MTAPSTQLAVLSALGGSAITSVGWGVLTPLVSEWAPWCKAAASFLDQFAASRERSRELHCACELKPELEDQISRAVQQAVRQEERKEEPVLDPLRAALLQLCHAGPWVLEAALAALLVAVLIARRMLWSLGGTLVGGESRPQMRAVRRRVR